MKRQRQRTPARPGLASPNQKQGAIETYKNGIGWNTVTGTPGQVPTVQSDGTVAFNTPVPAVTAMKVTVFTGNGTWTRDVNCLFLQVRAVGGGGGGGGADASGVEIGGGGGEGGGYAEEWYTAAAAGSSQSVTIGIAGSAGGTSGQNGADGGDTTFGSLMTALGGDGGDGTGNNSSSQTAYAGGASESGASGADFGFMGRPGEDSNPYDPVGNGTNYGGAGGNSAMGNGGRRVYGDAAGDPGTGYGGGGGGGAATTTTGMAGGAGTAGILIVVEYLSA